MTENNNDVHDALLLDLQRGLPLNRHPFADIGARHGMTEDAVLQVVMGLFESGWARRFGGVFDSRQLGYGSTLCAVDVPADDLERVAGLLAPHTGVTHCYEREGHPNLWFTMTAPASGLKEELARTAERLSPYKVLDLPALRRFKVQVVLDASVAGRAAANKPTEPDSDDGMEAPELAAHEKALVRKLQGNISVVADPFGAVADAIEWDPDDLLQHLVRWQDAGALRRVGIILRHRKAGFTANGMCVWCVPPEDIERAGRELAKCPEVTHCYERPPWEGFRFNLFAMIHARERGVARGLFERISKDVWLDDGTMLVSVREFKKTSPVFFCEESKAGS